MHELTEVPEWLGTAVIGAVIAALGYVAKLILEWLAGLREVKNLRWARLVELQSLLRATRVSFVIQNNHAKRLTSMIQHNHPELTLEKWRYEKTFTLAYPRFTKEERELHGLIRSITINSLRPSNQSLLYWLKTDTYFKAHRYAPAALGALAERLAVLEVHLILWHAKYEAWIPDTPEHCLVYMADEEEHGIKFPSGIDELVDRVLEHRRLFPNLRRFGSGPTSIV